MSVESLLDSFVDLPHTKLTFSLSQHGNDRVARLNQVHWPLSD